MNLRPIEDQVVVVFGASSGIGRETALRFAERGARVVVAARGEPGLDSLVEEIRQKGGQAIAVPAEASNFEQVQAVANRAVETYGRIDTWVQLPSVTVYAPFEQTSPEEFKRIFEVDLLGQAYAAQVALPYLKSGEAGAFIGVSSVEAEQSLPYHSAYAAAKHGVEGLLDALRMEMREEDAAVSITNIMPASINTPFFADARTKLGVEPRGIPPVYEPSVVADTILYAAEHPVREMVAGGAGQFVISLRRLAPGLSDRFAGWMGMGLQKTGKPKSANAPSSLFRPITDNDRRRGDEGSEARGFSLYTWLETHPVARWALAGAAMGAIGVYALRAGSPETYDKLSQRVREPIKRTAEASKPLMEAARKTVDEQSAMLGQKAAQQADVLGKKASHQADVLGKKASHQAFALREKASQQADVLGKKAARQAEMLQKTAAHQSVEMQKNAARQAAMLKKNAARQGAELQKQAAHQTASLQKKAARQATVLGHRATDLAGSACEALVRQAQDRESNRASRLSFARGLFAGGLFARGLFARGLFARGLFAQGPFSRGMFARGPFARGFFAHDTVTGKTQIFGLSPDGLDGSLARSLSPVRLRQTGAK
jgi:NAD(P)-dependent dehydrogenase (short-subunit alcohol dehydrogenase family)